MTQVKWVFILPKHQILKWHLNSWRGCMVHKQILKTFSRAETARKEQLMEESEKNRWSANEKGNNLFANIFLWILGGLEHLFFMLIFYTSGCKYEITLLVRRNLCAFLVVFDNFLSCCQFPWKRSTKSGNWCQIRHIIATVPPDIFL